MIALDLMILIPLALASVMFFAERLVPGAARWAALAASVTQLVLTLQIASSVAGGRSIAGGFSGGGGVWSLHADGFAVPLLVLTGLVGCLAVAASWRVSERRGTHFALLVLAQAIVAGVFLADNVVLFYVMWEAVLVPMFFLISGWGSSDARRAAMKFLVFTFAGGVVLLVGIIYVAVSTKAIAFSTIAERAGDLGAQSLMFWLLAVGLLVKLPAIGLHTWLPDAHTEAPTAGSIILAGVLLRWADMD
jgi:NADH:ubiquinone oxidoreductase subunit 4 (subunit M)